MTQEEIVKALKQACSGCDYHENPSGCCAYEALGSEAADLIETLTARVEKAEAELKEAVEDLTNVCTPGVHCWPCGKFGICDGRCIMNGGFQWRGARKEGEKCLR